MGGRKGAPRAAALRAGGRQRGGLTRGEAYGVIPTTLPNQTFDAKAQRFREERKGPRHPTLCDLGEFLAIFALKIQNPRDAGITGDNP